MIVDIQTAPTNDVGISIIASWEDVAWVQSSMTIYINYCEYLYLVNVWMMWLGYLGTNSNSMNICIKYYQCLYPCHRLASIVLI